MADVTSTLPDVQAAALTGTSREALELCLDRVSQRDADVLAWAHLDPELALAYADAADASASRSPLHGVPIGLKDIIDTADQPTGYGSPIWADHRPTKDAESVRRLRAAGAVIMGKTATTEFATYEPAATRNPHNLGHTPGGSSSGSAAAVADGQVQVALGTQTAGSVNRPGSFCGVFTFKPTYNRWPFQGVLPVALAFDTLGGFARDPRDLVRLDSVLANPRPEGTVSHEKELPSIGRLRAGILRGPWWDLAEPEAATMLADVASALRGVLGSVEDVEPSDGLQDLQISHACLQSLEASWRLQPMTAPAPERVSDLLMRHLSQARAMSADDVQLAHTSLRDARSFVRDVFQRFDVLITLAAPGEAPESLVTTGDPAFNRLASTAGVPAAGLPIGTGRRGLPLGLQIMAPPNADQALLQLITHLTHTIGLARVPGLPA